MMPMTKMKISTQEIKRALAAPAYDPAKVVIIVDSPHQDHWSCRYLGPKAAIGLIDEIVSMSEQASSQPPSRWGNALVKILAKRKTAIIKFYCNEDDRFSILLQGYDSARLKKIRADVALS